MWRLPACLPSCSLIWIQKMWQHKLRNDCRPLCAGRYPESNDDCWARKLYMLWWLVGWSCISETPDWSTEFQANPVVVREKLLSEPDGMVRLQVVNQLQSEFPGQVGELCAVLESAAQAYCLETEKRPHLWMPLKES